MSKIQGNYFSKNRLEELITINRDGLLKDTLPFWAEHCVDSEFGGFLFCPDRDSNIITTDKRMWQTCR
jgi:N-acylglucosamine 2-epimerase